MTSIFRKKESIGRCFQRAVAPFKSQRGIALLIVLSTITILMVAVVEFSYTTRVNYTLAVKGKERLQAYYLAKSALNLSKIILIYNKQVESAKKKAEDKLGTDLNLEPLYRMVPLSSEMLRGAVTGDSSGEEATDPEAPEIKEEEEEGDKPKIGELPDSGPELGMLARQDAEKFLDFEGDFSSEIIEEQTKFDINRFDNLQKNDPTKAYDTRKRMLLSILQQESLKDLFDNIKDATDLAHAISDWVDPDNMVDEFDQVQRGSENSLYSGQDYKPRNGKFLSLSELRLVHGMNDALYKALVPSLTVYGKKDQINVCLGSEEMVKTIIYSYTHATECAAPVEYDDKKMPELISTFREACPDVAGMVSALNSALSVTEQDPATPPPEPVGADGQPAAPVISCSTKLKNMITADNNVFTIKATGTVGETTVTVNTVLDTENKDSTKWPVYYYRIE